MPQVEQSIEIAAPIESVFALIAQHPERMADWYPPIELEERISPAPTTNGSTLRYVYNMMGVRIRGEHKVVTLTENQHLLIKTTSGIDSTFAFDLTPTPNGTKLTLRVEYTLPGSVLGQLMNRHAIEQKNARDLRDGLQNLKTLVERKKVK